MSTVKTYSAEELQAVLVAHLAWQRNEVNGVRADLSDADLRDADLSRADLRDADLSRANLRDADLRGAYLSGADLRGAILSRANLSRANLSRANLRGADLRGADLRRADLSDAKEMDSAIMPGGYTFAVYKAELVPALLTAGGKSLADVVNESWECHQWTNCPMATAFSVNEIEQIPLLHRDNARMFIQLFDANLIPNPLEVAA